MSNDILITGLGAVSPLGLSVHDHSSIGDEWAFTGPEMVAARHFAATGYEVLAIPSAFSIRDYANAVGLRRKQRFSQIAVAATADAYAHGRFADRPANFDRVGIVATTEYGPQRAVSDYLDGLVGNGLMEASPGLFTQTVYNVANGQSSIALGLRGANSTIVGGSAVMYAALLISTGKADAVFALSVDETNEIMTAYFKAALANAIDLAFPFRIGEAASVIVLESAESAAIRGADVLGELLGMGIASASGPGVTYLDWTENDDTIEYAMRQALDNADLRVEELDLVVATSDGLGPLTRSEFAAFGELGWEGPVAYPRLATGECFGGNEAIAYVLGLSRLEPGQTALITVATSNGGVTSTAVRKVHP
jgi:3-oxoacyl-[acyl-carrier-protein] synthase II